MITVDCDVSAKVHKKLATDPWLEQLHAYVNELVDQHEEFTGRDGRARFYSIYTDDEFLAKNPQYKYDFVVDVKIRRRSWLPSHDRYVAYVLWNHKKKRFSLRHEEVLTRERRKQNRQHQRAINRLKELIRNGAEWSEVNAHKCPWCGEPIDVRFREDGAWFSISCRADRKHFLAYGEVKLAPAWWQRKATKNWIEWDKS